MKEIKAMAIQIKMLTDAVALLAKNDNNKENNPNKPTGGGGREKKAIHQATHNGRVLLVARIPPSRRESHECNMHMEKRRP